jgi:putative hydrolase of the HAD superfamily
MPSDPPIVVSFDAAGTLIHLAEPVGLTYARVAAEHGVNADPAAIGRAFGTVWKRTPPPFSHGDSEAADDPHERAWWSRLVRSVFAETGLTFSNETSYESFFDALYLRFEEPGTWLAEPGTDAILRRIADAHRCIILSNFDARLRRILADLALLDPFEALFLSCEERLSKPDPRLFARVSERLGVAPESILHVGDDPVCDWAGAEAAGFRHFRVGRGQQNLRDLLIELSLA